MNDLELIKSTAAIHVSADLSKTARLLFNILLFNAYPRLLEQEVHFISVREVRRLLGDKSKNTDGIKDALRALRRADVEWNIFRTVNETEWRMCKDGPQHQWRNTGMLADAGINDDREIEYSYSPSLRERLRNPSLYARLSMSIPTRFGSKYTVALWEFLIDALRGRNTCTARLDLADLKKMLSIKKGQYEDFRVFKRRVLSVALKEINEHSEIRAESEMLRRGRFISAVRFDVERKRKELVFSDGLDAPVGQFDGDIINKALFERLVRRFGVHEKKARDLLRSHDPEYIEQNLEVVEARLRSTGSIKNVPGYVVRAMEQDYRTGQSTSNVSAQQSAKTKKEKTGGGATQTGMRRRNDDTTGSRKATAGASRQVVESMLSQLPEQSRKEVLDNFNESISKLEMGQIYQRRGLDSVMIRNLLYHSLKEYMGLSDKEDTPAS